MSSSDAHGPPTLWELAVQAAASSDHWRVQRHQVAALPEEAANDLLRRLVEQRRLSSAPQLHVFRHSVTALALPASTTSAHLAHLASFAALADLSLQGCTRLRDAHLAHLAPLAPSLQRLDLAGCTGLSGAGLPHLAALTGLRALSLARCTGLRDDGAAAALADACGGMRQLSSLDVSGLPAVDDATCCRLAAALPHLDTLLLASTAVGDEAMGCLERLRALRRLDVSFTQVHAPPVCPTLQQLSMMQCELGAAADSPQEAVWLELRTTLPALQELQLAGARATGALPGGSRLLAQLVSGAAGGLQRLSLHGASFSCGLGMLSECTALTWLDLAAAPVSSADMPHLERLQQLSWLSLAGTPVTDAGLVHVAAAPLTSLDLSHTPLSDGCWAVLEVLPLLSLDLSRSKVRGATAGHRLSALTSLQLLDSQVDDGGCRSLAAALPAVKRLQLGGRHVGDKGLRALCSSLPQLESLLLVSASVSDPGLLSALPRCRTLASLHVQECWLASEAGLAAAAAAARQAGGRLQDVQRDSVAVQLPAPARKSAAAAVAAKQTPPGPRRRSTAADGAGAGGAGGSGDARRPGTSALLTAEVVEHDERLAYSMGELLSLAPAPASPPPSTTPGAAADARVQRLRASLPPDLLA